MLLFTPQRLRFQALEGNDTVGHLQVPEEKFLIIDGQHRLAAEEFLRRTHPDDAKSISSLRYLRWRSDDFATEMFVIINSTPTAHQQKPFGGFVMNESSWAEPDRRFAARIVEMLYSEGDSPLRYRINRLGGRSKQEKWILQAELFNEIHRWIKQAWSRIERGTDRRAAEKYYAMARDFLKAAGQVFEDAWGNDSYMVTKPVTLKAMLRVCADLAAQDSDHGGRAGRAVAQAAITVGGTGAGFSE